MTKRVGTAIRKSRHKLLQDKRQRGKITIRAHMRELAIGDKVVLNANPALQSGRYHFRFHGRTCTVIGRQGTAYLVTFTQGNVTKTLIVDPVHIQKV